MKLREPAAKERIIKAIEPFTLSKPPFPVLTLTFGEHKSRRIGEGIEFKQFRPYEIGEDIANLDAEASLRTGIKLIRENVTEEKVRHAVILDDSPSMAFHFLRETAFIAAGCYLLSAVKDRDPARVIRVGGGGIAVASRPIYSAEDAVAIVLEYWDQPFSLQKNHKEARKSELLAFAGDASQAIVFRNTRIVLISDFTFGDARMKYDSKEKSVVFRNKKILQRAASYILSYPESSSLAFIGVSPQWEKFKKLSGLLDVKDSEDGSSIRTRFTKKRARAFVERQYEREKVWKNAAESMNIPMVWLHAGDRIAYELEKAVF